VSKRPRPTVIEKIQAKQAAAAPSAQINPQDIANVLVAARRALGGFQGVDLVNIAGSIANLEAALAALRPKPAEQPDAKPADQPAEKSKV
jgi:hypothetical protein